MTILSIHSQVVYGHVGHNATVPVWHRLGFEVWAVPTVLYSNHPGHGSHQGFVIEPEMMEILFAGLRDGNLLAGCEAVHTGYLGDASQGPVVLEVIRWIKSRHPSACYCCDPVIGDREGGLYVDPGIAEFLKSGFLPAADLATPNQFELEYFTGRTINTVGDAIAAADAMRAMGPDIVVATSIRLADQYPGGICTLAVAADEAWLCAQPELAYAPKGAGDLFAAVMHARLLQQHSLRHALSLAATTTHRIIELSQRAESAELLVIEGASLIDTPNNPIEAVQVR